MSFGLINTEFVCTQMTTVYCTDLPYVVTIKIDSESTQELKGDGRSRINRSRS